MWSKKGTQQNTQLARGRTERRARAEVTVGLFEVTKSKNISNIKQHCLFSICSYNTYFLQFSHFFHVSLQHSRITQIVFFSDFYETCNGLLNHFCIFLYILFGWKLSLHSYGTVCDIVKFTILAPVCTCEVLCSLYDVEFFYKSVFTQSVEILAYRALFHCLTLNQKLLDSVYTFHFFQIQYIQLCFCQYLNIAFVLKGKQYQQ